MSGVVSDNDVRSAAGRKLTIKSPPVIGAVAGTTDPIRLFFAISRTKGA